MRHALIFWVMGIAWIVLAVRFRALAWIAIWPGISFILVGCAYGSVGPALFGKQSNGRLAIVNFTLLLPYIVLAWATWAIARLVTSEPPCSEVSPGLWIGRRPLTRELPPDLAVVVDLTCELWEPGRIRRMPGYVCQPTLDESFPPPPRSAELIRRLASMRGTMLIHCAQGHGRSATLAAAVMVARGVASDFEDATRRVKLARPAIRNHPAQRKLAIEALSLLGTTPEPLAPEHGSV